LLDIFPRRRQGGRRTLGERHPDLHEHLLQASRCDRDQHLRRLVAFVLEAVGRADRHVGEHPRRRHDPLAVDRERDLALEDEEAFRPRAVEGGWGPAARTNGALKEAYLPLVSSPVARKRYTSPTRATVRPCWGLRIIGFIGLVSSLFCGQCLHEL